MTSENLLNKIKHAIKNDYSGNELISVATDGETFGHHKKFTERTLAHFLNVLAPQNNFTNVNFGQYLELYPPEYEVEIKEGEGTSWSCPHGVKRWTDDCGCGSGNGWHQKWRQPLRNALDWLRDQLIIILESNGGQLFKDVWQARNNYINVILNDTPGSRQEFLDAHTLTKLKDSEAEKAFALLEMQKFAMLMYTSCGWFFSEISGIETVKILEYAARAIEIAQQVNGSRLEIEFMEILRTAKSNLPDYEDGKKVYEKLVRGPV
jgi:alpha-amylase/alpha-mannosidase (GH57 family)